MMNVYNYCLILDHTNPRFVAKFQTDRFRDGDENWAEIKLRNRG
jgi:hypothetical protein